MPNQKYRIWYPSDRTMRYLLLVCVAMLFTGCTTQSGTQVNTETSPIASPEIIFERYNDEVRKFKDGDVICYLFRGVNKGGISCLRDATSSVDKEVSEKGNTN